MQFRPVPVLISLALIFMPACGSDDSPSGPGDTDTSAPGAITDLAIMSYDETRVVVTWTAPGDDDTAGTAAEYQIGYSANPITAVTWDACTKLSECPAPTSAGSVQQTQIDAPPEPDVYVAMKTVDEAGNWSALSNIAHGRIQGTFSVIQLTHEGSNRDPCLDDGFVVWVGWRPESGEQIWIAGLTGVTATPKVLTDNEGQKQHPSSHGREKIVWMGREGDGYDWEIFDYNHLSTPRYEAVTDDEVYDLYPVLAGGGDFAWVHGWEIHHFDGFGHNLTTISQGCCPGDTYSNSGVAADDGAVVWNSYERGTQEPMKVYRWNGAAQEITSELDGGGHSYSMDSGQIAFERSTQPSSIRFWDGATVHDLGTGADPSLDDGWIAFEGWDGSDWEIHLWDGVNIIPITDNDYLDSDPTLSGNLLAWVARPGGSGSQPQIFYTKLPER